MLKVATIYVDTDDMKKLHQIAKKNGQKAAYLVRRAIKEFLERTEIQSKLDQVAKEEELKSSYIVRQAVNEFIKRKEQEGDANWWRDLVEKPESPKPPKQRSVGTGHPLKTK